MLINDTGACLDLLADQSGQEGLSPYHFCDNNPANFVDPSGLADGIKVINTYGQASMVLTNDDLYGSLESWITDIYAWWILAAPPQDGGGSAQSNTLDNSNLAPMSNIAGPDMPTRSSSGPTGPDLMSQISSMITGNYSLSGSANASVGIGMGGSGGHYGSGYGMGGSSGAGYTNVPMKGTSNIIAGSSGMLAPIPIKLNLTTTVSTTIMNSSPLLPTFTIFSGYTESYGSGLIYGTQTINNGSHSGYEGGINLGIASIGAGFNTQDAGLEANINIGGFSLSPSISGANGFSISGSYTNSNNYNNGGTFSTGPLISVPVIVGILSYGF